MSVEFKKIDSLLPTKKSQGPEDRAMDIESALDWCRDNNVSPFDVDFTDKINKLGSIPVSRISPEDRRREVSNVLNWKRAGKPADMDTPDGQYNMLDTLLPVERNQILEQRAREIESIINWCRNHAVRIPEDGSLPGFNAIKSFPVSRRSPEDRKKDVEDILNWIRSRLAVARLPMGNNSNTTARVAHSSIVECSYPCIQRRYKSI
jgi:hypothetical protein